MTKYLDEFGNDVSNQVQSLQKEISVLKKDLIEAKSKNKKKVKPKW